MKTRAILLVLAVFLSAAVGFAADPHMGTWKLNEAKSTPWRADPVQYMEDLWLDDRGDP